ncbi:hypothetical protein ACJZ2D_015523 [Fusarium nematophilum]
MTTTATEARSRPAIEPIRTSGPDLSDRPLQARFPFKSPAWSASPLSPRSLPLPQYQESRDKRMREHDMAAVDRLGSRRVGSPKPAEPSLRNVSLRPIAELALPTPSTLPSRRSPLSAPLFAPSVYRRPTIAEETRNMLLSEPDSEHGVDEVHPYARRQSAPGGVFHARAMQLARQRGHLLRRRGFVGSSQPCEAELWVAPRELRRLSTIASHSNGEPPSPCPKDGRLTTRVIVHSRGQKPRVITRTFDLDELRATLPKASPVDRWGPSRRASAATLQPPTASTRPSSPAFVSERRHSYSTLPGPDSHRLSVLERRGSRQELPPVAMHVEYARMYFPVLHAVMLSNHVRPGDIIELPLPHPRAWPDTLDYVYTGRVALTEPIKENIIYLGGKVNGN